MTHTLAAVSIVLLVGMVLSRVVLLRRRGIHAAKFGALDKTDFFIPPFAIFYLYLIFASAMHWPSLVHSTLFRSAGLAWLGVALCLAGLGLMAATLVAFGSSSASGLIRSVPIN